MIGCKMAAMQPRRIASLTLFGTTPSGWHMLAGISTQPLLATLVSIRSGDCQHSCLEVSWSRDSLLFLSTHCFLQVKEGRLFLESKTLLLLKLSSILFWIAGSTFSGGTCLVHSCHDFFPS